MNGNPDADAPDGARLPGLLPREDGALPSLIARACNVPPLVVAVVHPCDATSLAALAALAASPLGASIEPLIVAPRAKVLRVADDAGVDLSKWTIEDVPHSHAAAARAVELAAAGRAGSLMKGSLHTDELMARLSQRVRGCAPTSACRTVS